MKKKLLIVSTIFALTSGVFASIEAEEPETMSSFHIFDLEQTETVSFTDTGVEESSTSSEPFICIDIVEELSTPPLKLEDELGSSTDFVSELSAYLEHFSERLSNPADIMPPRKQTALKKYEYDNMFSLLKKYTPKVKRYLDEVLSDIHAYVEQYGVSSDSNKTILREAIENVVYGTGPEIKTKRNQLHNLLFNYLF